MEWQRIGRTYRIQSPDRELQVIVYSDEPDKWIGDIGIYGGSVKVVTGDSAADAILQAKRALADLFTEWLLPFDLKVVGA
jgi:hypothetical protein